MLFLTEDLAYNFKIYTTEHANEQCLMFPIKFLSSLTLLLYTVYKQGLCAVNHTRFNTHLTQWIEGSLAKQLQG